MNEATETNKRITETVHLSRFIVVANIYLSKSKKTVRSLDLEGYLSGIARRDETLALLAGKIGHVNVVVFREKEEKP
jgi:hypothetical protein